MDTASANRQFSDNLPIYNLKAVVQETGLKPDTLRAWERRYGLPEPERTEGGHRLYSQYDIDTLKWLNARLDEGLNISRAVALWRELIGSGQHPLQTVVESPIQTREQPIAPPLTVPQSQPPAIVPRSDAREIAGDQIGELRQLWLAACLDFDEQLAEQALNQAFAILPVETVCTQIIQHGLAEIGQGWQQGQVTVQQEHFASALAIRRLHSLLSAAPPPTRTGSILVACPPAEEHTFSPILLTLLLRRRGWHVLYLGANVPISHMVETIGRARPTLVILTAQQLHTAATLLEMSNALRAHNLPMAYGGRIFIHEPSIRAHIAGYFLGSSFENALELIEQIMASPRPHQVDQEVQPAYVQALHTFQAHSAQIEASAWDRPRAANMGQNAMMAAFELMHQTAAASLTLGNASYLINGAQWIREYLAIHHQWETEQIDLFFASYVDAAQMHLPPQGELILQSLRTLNEPTE
ncbi:MAG: MerR family transcriptional regulator [Caldilineaceae bacterium]